MPHRCRDQQNSDRTRASGLLEWVSTETAKVAQNAQPPVCETLSVRQSLRVHCLSEKEKSSPCAVTPGGARSEALFRSRQLVHREGAHRPRREGSFLRADPPLYPRDPAARAHCRQLEAAADEIVFPRVWDLTEESLYPAKERGRDEGRLHGAQEALSRQHAELDKQLASRDYLCGDFSVADIGTFIMLSAGATLGAPVSEKCTNLLAWFARLGQRPAFSNEMAATQSFLAGALNPPGLTPVHSGERAASSFERRERGDLPFRKPFP